MKAKEANLMANIVRLDRSKSTATAISIEIYKKIKTTAESGFMKLEYLDFIPDYASSDLCDILKEQGYESTLIPVPGNINYYKIQVRWN